IAMRQRVARLVTLLLLVVAASAPAQVAQFLAIEGEGTASVFLDQPSTASRGRTAYITDGGQGGRRRLGGATVRGKDVVQYLLDEHVTRLVITCSHPHADHMAGLKKALRDQRILRFGEIISIDNGYDQAESLVAYFHQQWDSHQGAKPRISYVSAADHDAFAG